jgi:putative DNA primase/helicase
MVARVMQPGVKFDYSLVLEGRTGRRKSTFFSTLAGKEHFSDTHFDIGQGKDGWEQLGGLWIYELSELTALRKADSEQVKAFFSSVVDRYRSAYGKYVQAHPRQCVIGCSTNKRQYLYDLTGNRRFWPVWVEHTIRTEWLEKWRGQLFAEALAAYKAGERFAPTLEEEAEFFVPEQRKRLADTAVQSRLEYLLVREGATVSDGTTTKDLSVLTKFVTLDQLVAALGADPAKSTAQLEAQVRSWLEAYDWQAGRETTGLRRRGWRQPANWPPAVDDADAPPAPAPSNEAPDPENTPGPDHESDHARSREPGEDDDLPF